MFDWRDPEKISSIPIGSMYGIYANIGGIWDPCYHIYQHHGSVMGYDTRNSTHSPAPLARVNFMQPRGVPVPPRQAQLGRPATTKIEQQTATKKE